MRLKVTPLRRRSLHRVVTGSRSPPRWRRLKNGVNTPTSATDASRSNPRMFGSLSASPSMSLSPYGKLLDGPLPGDAECGRRER